MSAPFTGVPGPGRALGEGLLSEQLPWEQGSVLGHTPSSTLHFFLVKDLFVFTWGSQCWV